MDFNVALLLLDLQDGDKKLLVKRACLQLVNAIGGLEPATFLGSSLFRPTTVSSLFLIADSQKKQLGHHDHRLAQWAGFCPERWRYASPV